MVRYVTILVLAIVWVLHFMQYRLRASNSRHISISFLKQIRWNEERRNGIITCSALKKSYRTILIRGYDSPIHWEDKEMPDAENLPKMDLSSNVLFVYLKGSKEVIAQRIGSRKGHFMPSSLLDSQFSTLEEPSDDENYIDVDVSQDISGMIHKLLDYINQSQLLTQAE